MSVTRVSIIAMLCQIRVDLQTLGLSDNDAPEKRSLTLVLVITSASDFEQSDLKSSPHLSLMNSNPMTLGTAIEARS